MVTTNAEDRQQNFWKFRGCWVPVEQLELLKAGTINPTEFALLSVIDALSDPEGRGCIAENRYLGKLLGKSLITIKQILQRLKSIGIVIETGRSSALTGGQDREIETQWSFILKNQIRLTRIENNTGQPSPLICIKSKKKKEESSFGKLDPLKTQKQRKKKMSLISTNKDDCDKRDIANAIALKDALRSKNKLTSTIRISKWSNEFRLLRKNINDVTGQRVSAALDYVILNVDRIGKEKFPPVHSASAFRRHFVWIEEHMAKSKKTKCDALLTTTGEALLKTIKPKVKCLKENPQLRAMIELTLKNYLAFRTNLQSLAQGLELKNTFSHLLGQLPSPEFFVIEYTQQQDVRLTKWKAWSGNPLPFAFKPDNEDFQNRVRKIITKYGMSNKLEKICGMLFGEAGE